MLGFSLGRDWVAPAVTASIIALINTGDAILGAITEPLVGKLLDIIGGAQTASHLEAFNYHTYQIAMSMLPIYLIMAMFVLFIIKRLDVKNIKAL